jgi:hypothetical protein
MPAQRRHGPPPASVSEPSDESFNCFGRPIGTLTWRAAALLLLAVIVANLMGCLGTEKTAKADTLYRMRGDFRKGPFATQSDVRVSMLNRRGDPLGKNYQTATENDSGDFRLTLPGGVAEFSCTGKYFDEILGARTNGTLWLTAVAQVPEDGKRIVHVNAFTHMSAKRIKRLLAEGKKFSAAIAQAEKELRLEMAVAYAPGVAPIAGASMDLLGGNNPHTLYLFGVSSILSQAALKRVNGIADKAPKEMQILLDSLASDLEFDGKLGKPLKDIILAGERSLDPERAVTGLEAWAKLTGSNTVIPDLGRLVDTDKNGESNDLDPDDDGDMVSDSMDCAPLDSLRQMVSGDGQNCVAIYGPNPLIAVPEDKRIKLMWDPIPGDARYTLLYTEGDFLDVSAAIKVEGAAPGQVVGGLANGKTYSFAIKASYGERNSEPSKTVKAIPMGIASGFAATPGTGKVTLKWIPAEGASSYNLYMRTLSPAGLPGPGVDKADTKMTGVASPYQITSLKDGTRYYFALASVSGGSESRLGDTVSATPIQAPGKVVARSGDRMIIVTWDTAAGAETYNLYYGKGDTVGLDGTKRQGRVSPDTISGLANGTRYAIRLQSAVAGGESALGLNAWSIPMAAPSKPVAKPGTGNIKVSWSPAEGAAAYMVYYWTGKNQPLRASISQTSTILSGLVNGTTYSIRVAAFNSGIESFLGDTLTAIPIAAPEGTKAFMADGGVDLEWTPVTGATGYSVFFNLGGFADTTHARIGVKDPKASVVGLMNDSRYTFIVRAENGQGHSDLGSSVPGMPMRPAQDFTASTEADKVTLRWKDVPGVSLYNLYYAAASGVDRSGIKIANVKTQHVITGLEDGQLYTFAVEAVREGIPGPLSARISVIYSASTLFVGKAGVSDSIASYLSLALDASENPWLAFIDQGKAGSPLNLPRVVAYEGGSWVSKGKPSGTSPYSCCELRIGQGDVPYLAFADAEQGNRVTVKSYDGSGWTAVGGTAVSDSRAEFMTFSLDGMGVPYVGYNDSARSNRVSMKKLEGSKWNLVGLPGFSTNAAGALSLAFTGSNLPVLTSGGNGAINPTVMAYDSKTWTVAGDASMALSRVAPGRLPVGLSPANLVYVAFADKSSLFKTTVLSNNGSAWSPVGAAGFSEGSAQSVTLAVDPRGVPFVAYSDDSKGGRISMMKFENGAWTYACLPGFSKGRASHISLAIGRSGTVFAAFQDAGQGGKAVVMKLNQAKP